MEQGLRRGVRPGEGAVREVAAFLLDHEHFAGVPPTALVSCHTSASPAGDEGKVGSLQVLPPLCQHAPKPHNMRTSLQNLSNLGPQDRP